MSKVATRLARRTVMLSGLATALTYCSPGSDLGPMPELTTSAYLLGPGDVIRIITFGDQQLSGEFRIDTSGKISIPLLGNMQAAGLSTTDLQASLTDQLKSKGLFRDPSTAIEIVSYRPIFVLGEVSKPGQYPYQPGMTTLTAVAVAGGFTYRAIEDYASVVRKVGDKEIEGRVGRQALLEPGDVLIVFERQF